MFFSLLLITLLLATAVSFGVVTLFDKPIASILLRLIQDEISEAWRRYMRLSVGLQNT